MMWKTNILSVLTEPISPLPTSAAKMHSRGPELEHLATKFYVAPRADFKKRAERSWNVYENKGPELEPCQRSWNVYENKELIINSGNVIENKCTKCVCPNSLTPFHVRS